MHRVVYCSATEGVAAAKRVVCETQEEESHIQARRQRVASEAAEENKVCLQRR